MFSATQDKGHSYSAIKDILIFVANVKLFGEKMDVINKRAEAQLGVIGNI